MNRTQKTIIIIVLIALAIFLLWFFRYLVVCGLIAIILSYIGRPLTNLLLKFRYKKFKLGNGLAAGITLLALIASIFILFKLFVPLIISQAASFSEIDTTKLLEYYKDNIEHFKLILYKYGIIDADITFENFINQQLLGIINMVDYKVLVNSLFSIASEVLLGIFIVLFMTFFLLKEFHLISKIAFSLTPDKHIGEINRIVDSSQHLISRYFIGLCCEILLVTTLLTIGLTAFGFPNAVLIASCCGLLVIIPYIGAIIGGGIGLLICITSALSTDPSMALLPLVLKFSGIFLFTKLADDFVMQPLIYSKSVKAHPLEIFLVILMAGEIGGILGMIFAIPVYTLLRITAKEFFSNSKFVKSLTKNI